MESIRVHATDSGSVISIEGRLTGPGAAELDRLCQEADRPLSLDVVHLHSATPEGVDVLRTWRERGARFLGVTPYMELLLEKRAEAPRAAQARGSETRCSRPIKVLVVDDHEVVRTGTTALIREAEAGSADAEPIEVVGQAGNGREALERAWCLRPDVVLMDLRMPEMDGVEATRRILERQPRTRILVLTAYGVGDGVLAAVQAGARGYLSKEAGMEEYVRAIRRVHAGQTYLPPEITRSLLDEWPAPPPPSAPAPLTRRETEILCEVARGRSNSQVAEILFVSEVTVRTHLKHLYDKLGLTNRVELALYAVREGLVSL